MSISQKVQTLKRGGATGGPGEVGQGKNIKANPTPKKSLGSDNFSHKKGVSLGGPISGKGQ